MTHDTTSPDTTSPDTTAPAGSALDETSLSRERRDLLEVLRTHRKFLVGTASDLSDEQAASTPTVSELSVGGIIKHVTATEQQWARFMTDGASAFFGAPADDEAPVSGAPDGSAVPDDVAAQWADGFRLVEGETLASVLAAYEEVAAATDLLVATLPSLDADHPLPEAPWFEPGAAWSVRRCITHVVAETAQHAGHADIVRETIDGRKSMG